ncbi:hypothetical protein LTR05_008368 [Lithohypha guttulata]|uniref:Major facilitator superfamily (MFS) profile domain-containing protein n=1 Tax=Lithohypha guttulata TaxID=1690604 RepID=A0AAN7PHP6_9EURO|nr:hypothetical protein LTR05_008368 [Lithohypha guttulata]
MSNKEAGGGQEQQDEDTKVYPSRKVVLPAMAAVYMAVFLVALDRTIIGTAIPTITNDFKSFGDVAWYESGFLLPLSIFQLSFGLVYKYYSTKWVLLSLVAIFEIGSIICAAAPNSSALIVGRVVQGIGGAGISAGAFLLVSLLVPLQARPKYLGGLGAVFGVASIIGPVLGGYLTAVSWRWTFWINVPVGALSLALLFFLTTSRPPPTKPADTALGKLKQLDPLGFALIAPAITCLLFAIRWGGSEYSWSNYRVIVLFVVFGVCGVAFVAWQVRQKDKATVPPSIILQRSVLVGCIASIGIGSVLVIYAFYLPIWFQIIQGKSPESSGLSLIPLLLSNVLAVIGGGIATSALGYYTPFLIGGSALLVVGAGLITTWEANVGAGMWIGYQIVAGLGLGLILQQPTVAAQAVLPESDLSRGLSLLQFVNILGGTIFVTVSQTLLDTRLSQGLNNILPNFDPRTISNGDAASLRNLARENDTSKVLKVYNDSTRLIWYLALALSCWISVSSFGMEWKSVKKQDMESEKAVP